jgi:hypothetical protein
MLAIAALSERVGARTSLAHWPHLGRPKAGVEGVLAPNDLKNALAKCEQWWRAEKVEDSHHYYRQSCRGFPRLKNDLTYHFIQLISRGAGLFEVRGGSKSVYLKVNDHQIQQL